MRIIAFTAAIFFSGATVAEDLADNCTPRDKLVCDDDGQCDVLLTTARSQYHTQPWRLAPSASIDPAVTEQELGYLMSYVLLECGEEIHSVSQNEMDEIEVYISRLNERPTRAFVFRRTDKDELIYDGQVFFP